METTRTFLPGDRLPPKARTLRKHRELLLNYFEARKEFSSGVVEGSTPS